tara:strand:+ start:10475 stop:11530 length:1056 start_codon:yes stop_codon:yes gene_type:complete
MRKIKLAIVGCGRIFDKHKTAIEKLNKQYEIVSVCDLKLNKIKKKNFFKKIKMYSSIDAFCKNSNAELAVILTPSGLHYDHIIKLSNYFKNIVVEKPMVMNSDQAKTITKICIKKKINLFIVKQNRYNPAIKKLKEAIDQKRFGKIFLATIRVRWSRNNKYFLQDKWRGTWKNDGGVLANQASHHVDLLQWLMGDFKSVFAKTSKITKKTKAPDTCLAILKFKNGALGSIEATTATRPNDLEGSISILGENGTVVVGGYAVSKIDTWQFSKTQKKDKDVLKYSSNYKNVYGFGHIEFYKNVYNYLDNKRNNATTLKDGIKSIKIIDKIYASAEISNEVYFDDNNFSKKLGK